MISISKAYFFMRILVFMVVVFVLPQTMAAWAQPATIHDDALSKRQVAYQIDVTLDPTTKRLRGTQRVTWRNPDQVPVEELQFHLYLNAFKNNRSTFMKESGGTHRGFGVTSDDPWGSMDITRMAIAPDAPDTAPLAGNPGPVDLTDRITFIQPDDGNTDDQTVVEVILPEVVAPGETITLDIDFEAKMPEIFARTGWAETSNGNPFFFVAQWFPKVGVYEVPGQRYIPADAPRGAWNTHQFHANSEFYADFGTYDVSMTVPAGYTVGASGVLVDEVVADSMRTVTYRAEDVHDFAWTTSPDYLTFTDQWEHVNLRLLLQPEHAAQAERHFEAAKVALKYLTDWVGEYPYTTLTLVDGIGGSNGMEYPTLVTCGTVYKLPHWARVLEIVTIHEIGHQYFQGMIASNEFEEAWLDEGINSYLEMRIMDTHYGKGAVLDVPGFEVSNGAIQRLAYTQNDPESGPLFMRTWEYEPGDFSKASYNKPATVLKTLENYLGWETMQTILHTYYDRWRFNHPTTRDFIAVAEEVSGQSLTWFTDAYIYGTAVVDYAVDSIRNRNVADSDAVRSEVVVERLEDGVFPQTLRVTFEDGTTEERNWTGEEVSRSFHFNQRIVDAHLDPDHQIWLDIDPLNNRRAVSDNTLARKRQLQAMAWVQQVLYIVSGLF